MATKRRICSGQLQARARRVSSLLRAVVVAALVMTAVTVGSLPAKAQVSAIAISVGPAFPSPVQVGAQNQLGLLAISNNSLGSLSTVPVTITNIRLNPSCSNSTSGVGAEPCTLTEARTRPGPILAIDPVAVGRAGTGCAGLIFTVSAPNANGTVTFTPSGPVVLAPVTTGGPTTSCVIDFSFDVLQRPLDGSTVAVSFVDATAPAPFPPPPVISVVNISGISSITVAEAPTTIVTQASPQILEAGSTFGDTALVTGVPGGPPLTGRVVFTLYRSFPGNPGFPTCAPAEVVATSNSGVVQVVPGPAAPNGAPTATATFTPLPVQPAGRYVFVATYDAPGAPNPDINHLSSTSACGDPAEQVTVIPPTGSRYTPLSPVRIEDTRFGSGGLSGPVGPAATVEVQVSGRGGVPAGASAVVLNVTVTQPTAEGYLTLYPAGTTRPLAANVNFTPAKTVPNLAVVKLGTGGKVAMFNSAGSTHVVYDVAGYYTEAGGNAGRYQPLVPARIADTRAAFGGLRLGPGQSFDLQVTGAGGAPAAGVSAAVLNVAVTNTTGVSYLTVYPTGEARPLAANLNWVGGDTVSNRTMTKLGAGGKVTIYNNAGDTDVVVDLGGTYTDATVAGALGAYTPLEPARILDTRSGGTIPAGGTVEVLVAGQGGVPATGVRAVILSVAVTQPAGPGYLTIFPSGTARPLASDLNYATGETRNNLVVVQVGPNGRVGLFTSTQAHVVFDVAGWFT